jgi:hypothetical protein
MTPLRPLTNSINDLPIELLSHIFHLTEYSYLNDVLSLLHVCRLWRRVAYRTPSLWVIDNDTLLNPDTLQLYASTGRVSAVDLDFEDYLSFHEQDIIESTDVIVRALYGRLKFLRVVGSRGAITTFSENVLACAPSLRILDLNFTENNDSMTGAGLYPPLISLCTNQGSRPALQELYLTNVRITDWGYPRFFEHLRTLVIQRTDSRIDEIFTFIPSLCELIDVLSASPRLEYVTLDDVIPPPVLQTTAIRCIQLPSVKRLWIANDMDSTMTLLERISLPSSAIIHVHFNESTGRDPLVGANPIQRINPLVNTIFRRLNAHITQDTVLATDLRLEISNEICSEPRSNLFVEIIMLNHYGGGFAAIFDRCARSSSSIFLQSMLNSLNLHSIQKATLNVKKYFMFPFSLGRLYWSLVLASLPNLTALCLKSEDTVLEILHGRQAGDLKLDTLSVDSLDFSNWELFRTTPRDTFLLLKHIFTQPVKEIILENCHGSEDFAQSWIVYFSDVKVRTNYLVQEESYVLPRRRVVTLSEVLSKIEDLHQAFTRAGLQGDVELLADMQIIIRLWTQRIRSRVGIV